MFEIFKKCRPLYLYVVLEIINIIISHLYLDTHLVWRSITIFNVTTILIVSTIFFLLCKHSYCKTANYMIIVIGVVSIFGHLFAFSNRKHFFINNEGNVDFKR